MDRHGKQDEASPRHASQTHPGTAPNNDLWHELETLRHRLDALMGRYLGLHLPGLSDQAHPHADSPATEQGVEPDVDIYEDVEAFIVHIALPGIDPQDIRVHATEHHLTVSTESRPAHASPEGQMEGVSAPGQTPPRLQIQHRRSRFSHTRRFHFAYPLPVPVQPDQARASVRHGLLEIHLPKRQPTAHPAVPIPVQVSGLSAASPVAAAAPEPSEPPPPLGRRQEGNPTQKLGATYAPSAVEDHTTQAQSVGERIESASPDHQRRVETSNVATGQTNPMQPPPPTGSATEETPTKPGPA